MAGGWNGNTYSGDDSNDVAVGTSAVNSMFGYGGDDNLRGGGGDDAITGGVGNDDLQGEDGNDRLWDVGSIPGGFSGLIGHDTLRGGAGDDHLNVWSPDTGDVADGGAGFDTLEVRFNWPYGTTATGTVSFVLGRAPSVIMYNEASTVAVSNIERMLFVSGDGNDFITGGDNNDTIAGMLGNDVLKGMGGDDILDGGRGTQDIDGGKGFDRVSFDLSDTTAGLSLRNGGTISLGASGSIKSCEWLYDVSLGQGSDTVTIDQANGITLQVNDGDDRVTLSGISNDRVSGGLGADTIETGQGDDYVDPGFGSDLVRLGAGNDRLSYSDYTGTRTTTGDDRVFGGAGDDSIYTPSGADLLEGEAGNDALYGGAGADVINGGDGNDVIRGEGGADVVTGGEGDDVIETDYDFWSSTTTTDNDKLEGGAGADSLTAGGGRDLLYGGAGDDQINLTFDTIADKAFGGDGLDELGFTTAASTDTTSIKVVLGATTQIKADGQVVATATSMERLVVRAQNAGNHTVVGGVENDSVFVGSGRSRIEAGDGADTIHTGSGSDTVDAGAGSDNVTSFICGQDDVALGEGDDYLLLYDYGIADDLGVGGASYIGGSGVDRLELWLTNQSGSSFDGRYIRLNGDIVGEVKGFESVKYNGSTGGFAFNGTAGADSITLTAAGVALGKDGADTLTGGSAADSLDGGAGADRLIGNAGADTLTGGTGADVFVFTLLAHSADAAADTITDFSAGDLIDLSGIDADTVSFGNQAFHLGGGGGHAGDIVLVYDAGTDRTSVNLYVDSDATADGTIWLAGDRTGLTEAAFVL